jgi:hypothetical protein
MTQMPAASVGFVTRTVTRNGGKRRWQSGWMRRET